MNNILVNITMESKTKIETEKILPSLAPEKIINFEVINNTDQHLFLTEEKLVLKAVEWNAAALEKIGKPVIIKKMGGSTHFVININVSMKTNSQLTWTGGCDLLNFVLSFINAASMNVRIDDKRYYAKIESIPTQAYLGAPAHIRITFSMKQL
jgi:hypothetical protein